MTLDVLSSIVTASTGDIIGLIKKSIGDSSDFLYPICGEGEPAAKPVPIPTPEPIKVPAVSPPPLPTPEPNGVSYLKIPLRTKNPSTKDGQDPK